MKQINLKINNIDKPVAIMLKMKRKKTQIINFTNEMVTSLQILSH
jgi:hypothetical protein